jgi:hypothetical protein
VSRDLTEDLLLEAIRKSFDAPPGEEGHGITVHELARATGLPDQSIRVKIRELIEQGQIKSSRRIILDIAGRRAQIPAYVYVSKKD